MSKIQPLLIPIGMLVLGIAIGVFVGFAYVDIIDTGPWQLHPSFQAIYVRNVADSYANNGDTAQALRSIGWLCEAEGVTNAINTAKSDSATTTEQQANLDELALLTPQWAKSLSFVCSTQPADPIVATARQVLPILALVAVLGFAGFAGYSIYTESKEEGGTAKKPKAEPSTLGGSRASSKKAPTIDKAKSPAAKGAAIAAVTEKTDYAAAGNPPIVQFMTTYLEGDDLFDDSFSIETAAGEFLGETGVGISETLGVGEPKRVTAMEVWLFDKNDIRTVTKVLMSDHAFNDETLKAKLAPKGEAALAEPNTMISLDTATLRIQAKVVDVEYGSGPLPPNSFFKRITIELAAWKRDEVKSPAP